jgi:hypothetical protein
MQLLKRIKFQSQNAISTVEESLYLLATRGMMRAMLNANCVRNIHESTSVERTDICQPGNVRLINRMHQVMSRVQPFIFYNICQAYVNDW